MFFNGLFNICIIILTLIFLIGFHEWGHCWTAQKLGFDVERLSIGLGRILYSRTSAKTQTQYALCVFPVGGYVKFRDQSTFDSAPIFKRAIVIFAGPFFNLIFAFLAYWLLFIIGITSPLPIIEKILPDSIAEKNHLMANSEIISIDGKPTQTWAAVLFQLLPHLGNKQDSIIAHIQDNQSKKILKYTIFLDQWALNKLHPNFLESLGLVPAPAKTSPLLTRKYSFFKAALKALEEVSIYLKVNIIILKKLLTGVISLGMLAGPIGLFNSAVYAAHQGFVLFLAFLGFLSTGLAFANLLPIPGLDGAALTYLGLEVIRQKPLSIPLQILLFRLGIIFLCVIMFQALVNDLMRFA